MVEASDSSLCKTFLPSALRQEVVPLVLPSWELLLVWFEKVEGGHRVRVLVQGGRQERLSHVWYWGDGWSGMIAGLGTGWGLLKGLEPEVVPS